MKLTKKYKVVHKGTSLVMPVLPEGDNSTCWPAKDATAVEFDTYEEAQAYVLAHGLVYTDPETF